MVECISGCRKDGTDVAEYLFGLADLQVTTAGGQAEIEYLDNDVADSIADDLNRIVNSIVRGRNEDA